MKLWKAITLSTAALAIGLALGRSNQEETWSESTGARFHEETKHTLGEVISSVLRWGTEPDKEKSYDNVTTIELPTMADGSLSVEEAISLRRSSRDYSNDKLPLSSLARLLYASSGVTGEGMADSGQRSAPSAGALYPIETYVVVFDVEGVEAGIYHYSPSGHKLELIRQGHFRNDFISAALHQDMAGRCNVLYVLTAVFRRTTWKYGERGYRYAYIEAGAISENIYLQATSLGLGSVLIGAFFDSRVSELMGIDGRKEAPILLHAVGTL